MPRRSGAELVVETLSAYGVSHVFGNPGTTELPVVRALSRSDVEYVLGLHEDVAVGMAAGYASTRRYHAHGEPGRGPGSTPREDRSHNPPAAGPDEDSVRDLPLGVVNLHVTPGVAHGLGNLYNAWVAGAPLLVTAGDHSLGFRHEDPILSGDLVALADQFTKWSGEVLDVDSIPTMLRRAVRIALTPPTGPVFLGLPLDVMRAETGVEPVRLGHIPRPGSGDGAAIEAAADALAAASDPVLVLGDGVARAGSEAVQAAVDLAEAAGARVHAEILACEVNFPADHEQWVSYIPPDEDTARTLMSTDLLAFVGTSTNTTLTAHEAPLVDRDTTNIHIGHDASELGKLHPADVAVLGDPGRAMAAVADRLADRIDDAERADRLDRVRAMKEMAAARMAEAAASRTEDPLPTKPELVDALRETVPDAYVVDEGVTAKYALLTRWPFDAEGMVSNKGGGLGYGLPAAIGAAIAESQQEDPRDVLGFVGDGSYLYYPHAIYTAVRYDVDVTVVVVDNRKYRILEENAAELFDAEPGDVTLDGVSLEPPVDIPANARSHGATGHMVEEVADIAPTVRDAVEAGGPTVVDVLVRD